MSCEHLSILQRCSSVPQSEKGGIFQDFNSPGVEHWHTLLDQLNIYMFNHQFLYPDQEKRIFQEHSFHKIKCYYHQLNSLNSAILNKEF